MGGLAAKQQQGAGSSRRGADALATARQLASVVAHDVRQPLRALVELLNNLTLTTQATSPQEKYLVNASALTSKSILETLETLYVATSKDEDLTKQAIILNLRKEIEAVVCEFWPGGYASSPVELNVPLNCVLNYPPSALRDIVRNLISNATKYCRPDVDLNITVTVEQVAGGVRMEIADNGLGIDLEKYGAKLFGMNCRFHPGHEGRGIGLFQIKSMIDTLDGEIRVESEPNQGSNFKVLFRDVVPKLKGIRHSRAARK